MIPAATLAARTMTMSPVSFPRTIEKIGHLIEDGTAPTAVVTSVIASDPMLAAMVIGQANVAMSTPVTRLSQAVLNLGLGTVLAIIRDVQPIPVQDRRALAASWALANASATMSGILSERGHVKLDHETAHLIGLLHDLGTIVAILHFPGEHARAGARVQSEPEDFPVLLRRELGADAGDLGGMLASSWNLPGPVAIAMRHHLDPIAPGGRGGEGQEIACLAHVARVLARCCGFASAGDPWVAALDERALAVLRIRPEDLDGIIARFHDDMDELELYEGVLGR